MSELHSDSSTDTERIQLSDEVAALRQQIWTLLVLLLVVSGTFSIFLVRQVSYARKELINARQFVASGQNMDQIFKSLAEYSKTHPDFAPILTKNGITVSNSPPVKK